MSPTGLSSVERRMKVSSPNCYNFKKPSVLAQTIVSSHNSAHLENFFSTILTAVRSIKVFLIPWYTHPVLKNCVFDIRNQSEMSWCVMNFLKAGLCCSLDVIANIASQTGDVTASQTGDVQQLVAISDWRFLLNDSAFS